MTMTDDTTGTRHMPLRTYAVGDQLALVDNAHRGDRPACDTSTLHGYICSLPAGHVGPQHVAAYTNGQVVQVVDRDTSGDPVEGTFEPGDMVQALPGLPVGTVLSVGRDDSDGIVRAWLVGQRDDSDTWRLMKSPVDSLSPHTGSHVGPTLADIGAALRDKAATMDADVERNRETRRIAEREAEQLREEFEQHKHTVARVARQKAKEHDWCSVVDQALREMGLSDYGNRTFRVSVTIRAERTVDVQVSAANGEEAWQMVDRMSESELADAYEEHNGDSFDYAVLDGGAWTHTGQDASTSTYQID